MYSNRYHTTVEKFHGMAKRKLPHHIAHNNTLFVLFLQKTVHFLAEFYFIF